MAEHLGDESDQAGLYDEADRAYKTSRKLFADDIRAQARILGKQGLIRERAGNYSVALRWLSRGLNALEADHSPEAVEERVELQLHYSGVRYRQGRYHDCVAWAQDALALGPSPPAEAHARYLLGLAYAHLANPESQSEGERALRIYEDTGDLLGKANTLNNLGLNAYYRGAWNQAIEYWEQSRLAREACGDIIGAATATNNLGEVYSDQGRFDQGRKAFTEALRIWEGANYGVGIALASSNLGRLEARSGNHEKADSLLERGREKFAEIGAGAYVVETELRMAENMLFRGDPATLTYAQELLPKVEAAAGDATTQSALHRVIGYARLRLGDVLGAAAEFRRSLDLAESVDAAHEEAFSHRALARAGVPDADEHNRAADALYAKLGIVPRPER